MFDQLTESNNSQQETRGRRGYFIVTALLVGALFLSGVIWSLYGKDLVLGSGDMELSAMVAPVAPPENAPRPPQPRQERHQTAQPDAKVTTRQTNMLRVDEVIKPPTGISTTPNTSKARTDDFRLDKGPEKNGGTGAMPTGITRPGDGNTGGSSGEGAQTADVTPRQPPPPPPVAPPVEKKKEVILSGGVVTGKATKLPTPFYPPAAIALSLKGIVTVEVLIDEAGNVISAKAVSGPAMLRQSAERAARDAKFHPTLLSNEPVKVTGIISYNFNRG